MKLTHSDAIRLLESTTCLKCAQASEEWIGIVKILVVLVLL